MDLKKIQMSSRDTGNELAAGVGKSGQGQDEERGGMEVQHTLYKPLFAPLMSQGDPIFYPGARWR